MTDTGACPTCHRPLTFGIMPTTLRGLGVRQLAVLREVKRSGPTPMASVVGALGGSASYRSGTRKAIHALVNRHGSLELEGELYSITDIGLEWLRLDDNLATAVVPIDQLAALESFIEGTRARREAVVDDAS